MCDVLRELYRVAGETHKCRGGCKNWHKTHNKKLKKLQEYVRVKPHSAVHLCQTPQSYRHVLRPGDNSDQSEQTCKENVPLPAKTG
jgi:hypothetical protein